MSSAWAQNQRAKAWQRVADELSLPYLGKENDLVSQFQGMRLFSRGRSRRFRHAIAGDTGDTKITIGDYRFRTGSGKNSSTHVYTMCVLQSEQLAAPHCHLRPEMALFDKLGAMLGGQDINFADDAEFSSAYVLQGEDETAIRELFDEQVRSWFVAKRGERFHFEVLGDRLAFHYGKRRSPDDVRHLMEQALEVMNLLAKA